MLAAIVLGLGALWAGMRGRRAKNAPRNVPEGPAALAMILEGQG